MNSFSKKHTSSLFYPQPTLASRPPPRSWECVSMMQCWVATRWWCTTIFRLQIICMQMVWSEVVIDASELVILQLKTMAKLGRCRHVFSRSDLEKDVAWVWGRAGEAASRSLECGGLDDEAAGLCEEVLLNNDHHTARSRHCSGSLHSPFIHLIFVLFSFL